MPAPRTKFLETGVIDLKRLTHRLTFVYNDEVGLGYFEQTDLYTGLMVEFACHVLADKFAEKHDRRYHFEGLQTREKNWWDASDSLPDFPEELVTAIRDKQSSEAEPQLRGGG